MWVNCLTHTVTHTPKGPESDGKRWREGRAFSPGLFVWDKGLHITCVMKLPIFFAACSRVCLVVWGYNTCYRNSIAPGETERICRKVGAHRKEARGKGDRSPAQIEYDRTYNRLKQRKNRGKISVDEWNTAVAKAQTLLDQSGRGELTDEEPKRKLKEL